VAAATPATVLAGGTVSEAAADTGPFGGRLERGAGSLRESLGSELAAGLRFAAPAPDVPGPPLTPFAGPTPLAPVAGRPLLAGVAPWSIDPAGEALLVAADPADADRLGAAAAPDLAAVAAAARRVASLHAAGRSHGDLRPEVLRAGAEGPVLLVPATPIDAQALLQVRLRAGAGPNAVAYVAPEVVRGGQASPAADVYALAAMAYAAATGHAPLGQMTPERSRVAPSLWRVLARALDSWPGPRPPIDELAGALEVAAAQAVVAAQAATQATPANAVDADGDGVFELVDAPATGAPRARILGSSAPGPEKKAAEGQQVSAILVLVYGLGGLFVLVGAIGLAVVLGGFGILLLLGGLTAGAWFGGTYAERRGSARGGLALVGIATQLLWADAAYVLTMGHLADQPGAWAVVSALVAAATAAVASSRRSAGLGVLAGLGALVACACLWGAVGPGGRVFLLVVAAGGLLAGGRACLSVGRTGEGLALVHVGCLLFLAIVGQLLNALDLLEQAGPWSLACAVAALATGALAARLRQPGLWVIAGLQAFISLCALWALLDPFGRGLLCTGVASLLVVGGLVVARTPTGGAAVGVASAPLGEVVQAGGTLVGWVAAVQFLDGQGLQDAPGAWAAAGGVIAGVAHLLAWLGRSTVLAAVAVPYLGVAALALGKHLSTGSVHGLAFFAALVTLAHLGVSTGLHLRGGAALGVPAAIGAALWAWVSAAGGFTALAHHTPDEVFATAWPLGVTAVTLGVALLGPMPYRAIAGAASYPLVALVPTALAFYHHESVAHLQLSVGCGFVVIAAAFHAPGLSTSTSRQVVTILPALVPVGIPTSILCLVKCGGKDGLQLLVDAVATGGKVHETPFAYLASVVGTSGVLIGLAFLFAPRAASRGAYRLLEATGLALYFGTITILSMTRMSDWLYPLLIFGGGAVVIGLGTWQRRALLVAAASTMLFLNLWLQYFAKLHDQLPTFGLLLGFGLGLVAFGLLYERRVKHALPALKTWG
jgi:hypothetical protein